MDDILDGGSAAPVTPDVPTTVHPALACPSIIDPDSYWVPGGCACVLTRGRNPDAPTVVDDSECPIHSGVAGEPKATTKGSCCPEFARNGYSHTEICPAFEDNDPARPAQIAVDVSGTQGHSPNPSNPSVELSTGCVVVPDEAVEAFARADELAVRATKIARSVGDRCLRDWHGMANRDAYVGQVVIRAALEAVQEALTGVIPGIVEVAVEEAEKDLRPLIAAQALRQAARDFNHPMCSKCANELDERADELERGGDQPEPADDDGPTASERDDLAVVIAGRIDHAQRMGAAVLANALLDAGYRKVERGGDR